MGLLSGQEDTIFDGDLHMIKNKIFKRCHGQGIETIELIDVYTLVALLDIPFEDIDWLIMNNMCIEIPRAIKIVPYTVNSKLDGNCINDGTRFPMISNLDICKRFMNDKESFCELNCDGLMYYENLSTLREIISKSIMCCYLSFTPDLEIDYMAYKKMHPLKVSWDNIITSDWRSCKLTSSALSNALNASNIADISWPLTYDGISSAGNITN